MQATLAELAALVEGNVTGPADRVIHGVAPLGDVAAGQITMVDREEKCRMLAASAAAAVVAPRSFLPQGIPVIQVPDVHRAFSRIVVHFRPQRLQRRIGISPLASISPTAKIGPDVDIHPFATIGDDVTIGARATIHGGVHVMAGSEIGEDTVIFPNVVLYENTIVGPRCLIHASVVLGAYGFGYEQVEGRHRLTAQLGNVVIGADVEIGAGTTIDRGTYGPTRIGEGTKIDNLVMIAHNCHIGSHNMLCSQVGIAGSTVTGDHVIMAGQVGVRDHVRIGDRAAIGAKAGVINDVPDGSRMIGIPATPERDQKIKQAMFTKLPEMRQQLKQLQRAVEQLTAQLAAAQPAGSDDDRQAAA